MIIDSMTICKDRYTNVLESIRGIKKEKTQDLKVMHASLEFLRRNKEKAERVSICVLWHQIIPLRLVHVDFL